MLIQWFVYRCECGAVARVAWTERHEIGWQFYGLTFRGGTKWSTRMDREDAITWPAS